MQQKGDQENLWKQAIGSICGRRTEAMRKK